MLHHILYDQLGWPPGDEAYLIATDPLVNSRQDREAIAQLMFETFNVMGYYVVDSAVSSLYAMGKTQGVVVNVGHTGTDICQVLDGALLPAVSQRLALGGAALDERLRALLVRRGVTLPPDEVQRLKEAVAAVADSRDDFLAAAAAATDGGGADGGADGGAASTSHTLPDGQTISVSALEGYALLRVRLIVDSSL